MGFSPASGVSSTLAGMTKGTSPTRSSSSSRRGDAEARMRSGSAGMGAWLLPCATSAAEVRQPAAMSNRIACVNVLGGPAGLLIALLLVAVVGACAPDTELTAVSRGGTARPPLGPAGAALVDPPAGATDVPVNLAAIVLRLPAPVLWGSEGLRICEGASARVPSGPPAEESCTGGVCYR